MGWDAELPMKVEKHETPERLVIERTLYLRKYSLTLNRERCVGCELCSIVCPREAITVSPAPKEEGKPAQKPIVDVDEEKCTFCGVCNAICPFGAVQVRIDGEEVMPVVESESFPQLVREIYIDSSKCDVKCLELADVCPLNIITLKALDKDGKEIEDISAIESPSDIQISIEIEKEACPCCKVCEFKFPPGAIRINKIFHGRIRIISEKCPEGCRDCVDVCPIDGTLYVGEDGKVHVNEATCVYCGACRIACPEDAIDLQRIAIRHTPVKSGAWNKALEKLTSPERAARELLAKGFSRARDSVWRRLGWGVPRG